MAKMAVIFLLLGILSGTGRAAKVQAAETPLITKLQVAATEDGIQIMAQCDFQNYDEQSGCVMTLYLYRVGDENEMSIAAYKKIPYGIILLSRYQFNNYPTHPARQTSRVFPCPFGKTQSCSDVRPGQ